MQRERLPLLSRLAQMVADLGIDTLPEPAAARYRLALLDLLGSWIAGREEPSSRVFGSVLAGSTGNGGMLLDAARIAASAHALELDDVHIDVTGWHPSVAAVSPLLALGRQEDLHGSDLLAGVVAGWEVGGRIGAAITPAHRLRGFHATGTIGAIAAAAAAGRARRLSAEQLTSAMGLATSMASGTFGILAGAPETKHLHAAHGAMAGLFAVLLAEQGMRGPAGALEAPEGFFFAYADNEVDLDRALRPLGQPWEIERQMVKPHACCGHAFGAIDAAWALASGDGVDLDSDEPIDVHTYAAASVLGDLAPEDPVAARLSIPYCVAQVLTGAHPDGLLGTDAFEPAHLDRDDLRRTLERVRVHRSAESDAVFPARRITRVESGGRSAQVEYPRGMPENPVDEQVLRTKFAALVGAQLGEHAVARLTELVADVVTTPSWVTRVDETVAGATVPAHSTVTV